MIYSDSLHPTKDTPSNFELVSAHIILGHCEWDSYQVQFLVIVNEIHIRYDDWFYSFRYIDLDIDIWIQIWRLIMSRDQTWQLSLII